MPKISVIMPVNNVDRYIDIAVRSILTQTFRDFEFLIIDDGSTDQTWMRLLSLASGDDRIRLWRNESNQGLARTVNSVVPLSRGEYIARMDGDDVAIPDRFAKQLAVLDSGAVDLCGGWVLNFGDGGDHILTFPEKPEELRLNLLFDWSLLHPTIMMRRSVLERVPFQVDKTPATDFDFFVRAAECFRLYNLPEILLYRRMHGTQVSERYGTARMRAKEDACELALRYRGIRPNREELRLHALVHDSILPSTLHDIAQTKIWLERLAVLLQDDPLADSLLKQKWYAYCLRASIFGLRVYRLFRDSSLRGNPRAPLVQELILFMLCICRIRYRSKVYQFLSRITKTGRRMRALTMSAANQRQQLIHSLSIM